ncbi:MAG: thioredoxin-like domain-containing protein [Anaerolineaceae bacterium]
MAFFLLLAVMLMGACGGSGRQPAGGKELSQPTSGTGAAAAKKSWAGTKPAPAIPTGVTWFNVEKPLTLAELKGKVVLLDFWTLGCINCQHIIPDLKKLEAEFSDALVVIGVHSGKYSTEHDDESIREAVQRYGLEHPVLNDPDFKVWETFGASAWPTIVLVDPAGNLVGGHAGEGVYPLFQPIVSSLVEEFGAKGAINRAPFPLSLHSTATATLLSYPGKVLADDAGGRLFIADSGHNRILISDFAGRLQTAIGSGVEGFADGAANEASFRQPQGLAISPDGKTLYVADTRNHAIRKVNLGTNEVTTIAGTGKQLEKLPGTASKAKETALASPWDLVQTGDSLFIAMAGIHQIWAMNLVQGTVSVFAGTSREGIADGDRRTQATLAQPSGITADGSYLYWVDPESSSVRRALLSGNGEVETIVGTGLFDYGNEDGRGKSAKLQHPQGVVFADGRLYVSDTYNHEVRRIDAATFDVTTVAGTGARGWSDGPGQIAMFDEPAGVGFARGTIYVADANNHLIRALDIATARVSTLTLSNLSVASALTPGRILKVTADPQTVTPGAANLRVTFNSPAGYHLNSQAPSRLILTSSNPAVLELGERILSWSSDEATITLPVPAVLKIGKAALTGAASVYYCRSGEEALCFISQLEVSLVLTVDATATQGEVVLTYALPVFGG